MLSEKKLDVLYFLEGPLMLLHRLQITSVLLARAVARQYVAQINRDHRNIMDILTCDAPMSPSCQLYLDIPISRSRLL